MATDSALKSSHHAFLTHCMLNHIFYLILEVWYSFTFYKIINNIQYMDRGLLDNLKDLLQERISFSESVRNNCKR